MADRYWVGGTGNWNDTNSWSTASGGGGGASVPTSADNAIFDAASDTGAGFIVTVNVSSSCLDFNASAVDQVMTLAGSSALAVAGNLTWHPTNFTRTYTGAITFSATTSVVINPNGITLTTGNVTFDGVGGTFTLGSGFIATTAGTTTLTNGTIDLSANNYTLTTVVFSSTNSNTRSINFRSGKIVVTGSNTTLVNFATATNFTWAGTDPRFESSATPTTGTRLFALGSTAGGSETTAVSVYILGGSDTVSANTHIANLSFSNFTGTLTGAGRSVYRNLTFSSGMTLGSSANPFQFVKSSGATQDVTFAGNSINQPVTINGVGIRLLDTGGLVTGQSLTFTAGTIDFNNFTLNCGTFSSSNANVRSFVFGTTGILNCTRISDAGDVNVFSMNDATNFSFTGTSNITFSGVSTVAGRYRGFNLGNTAGGSEARAMSLFVTAGVDDVGFGASNTHVRNVNFSTGTFTGRISATGSPIIYGNLTLNSSMSVVAGTNIFTFSGSAGTQVLTSAGVTIDRPVTINTTGATVQLAGNTTIGSTRAVTLTQGTLDVNGKTLTIGTFVNTGAATRAIAFGTSGNITVSGSGATAWNASGSGFTSTGTTSTISMTSASAKTFVGGGYTYAAALNQGGAGTLTISGNNTFQNITNTYGAIGATTITFTAGTTQTVAAFTASGTAGNLLTLNSSTPGTRFTLNGPSGVNSVSYCAIQDSAALGGARWQALLTNGNVNNGNNIGWVFAGRKARTVLRFRRWVI